DLPKKIPINLGREHGAGWTDGDTHRVTRSRDAVRTAGAIDPTREWGNPITLRHAIKRAHHAVRADNANTVVEFVRHDERTIWREDDAVRLVELRDRTIRETGTIAASNQ